MNINELMINDLVYHKDKPVKITKGIYDGKAYTNDLCILDFKLSPIPLTADILEKNGWLYDDMCNEYHHADAFVICGRNTFTIFDGVKISYIHELQHALRLSGLCELAINFKVE